VLGADPVRLGIKADQIARTHIDSADRETHRARIDPIEIDKALKGRAQLRRFIVAGGAGATGRNEPRWFGGRNILSWPCNASSDGRWMHLGSAPSFYN
jgi:hypothetical protein